MKIHYGISKNEMGVGLCGRLAENNTRNKQKVTCKICQKALKSKNYSIAQFIGE